jgi:hypothetical protein
MPRRYGGTTLVGVCCGNQMRFSVGAQGWYSRGASSLLFPQFRLPSKALPAICAQGFDLLDGREDELFHAFLAKQSTQEQTKLEGTNSQEIHQRV